MEQLGKFAFRIILTQGLNRQIRRMCEYLGYEVVSLKRIRIVNIPLDVPVGKYRHLTPEELDTLDRLIGDSVKTEEASRPAEEKSATKPELPKNTGRKDVSRREETSTAKRPQLKGRNRKS